MKSIFTFSLLVPLVFAQMPASAYWYTITTKAQVKSFDNLFIFAGDGQVWATSGTIDSARRNGMYYTTRWDKTKTLGLHLGNRQLGLQIQIGDKGLMTLVNLFEPTAQTIPKDMPTEWSVFEIGGSGDLGRSGELTVKDGQNVSTRQWISYLKDDGAYYVGLWDGVTPQPRTFVNITLIATPVLD